MSVTVSRPTPPVDDSSKELVKRIQAGEDKERNFERLYRLHYRRVFLFFIRLGFTVSEGEELTQDTFLRVYNNIGGFQHGSHFVWWLLVIAANVYRNEIRRRRAVKRGLAEVPLEDEETAGAPLAILAAGDLGPLDMALDQERRGALRRSIDELPKQMRQCVQFRIYHMLKYRQIAELMHISIETVKAHLHQAQERLKVNLVDRPPACARHPDEDDEALPEEGVR
jgi:RNA polymerase sigma-70 factor (ECF subfamily)